MAEKVSSDSGNIVVVLTSEEYEEFRRGCVDLLEYYELSKTRASRVRRILDKLEEVEK